MQQIKFLQAVDGHKAGDIATVENNEAHRYIENGQGELVNYRDASNRMVEAKQTKRVKNG